MFRLSKIILGGIIAGITGIAFSMIFPGIYLEENIGLSLLFQIRGVQKAPSEVYIVDLDKESAQKLNIDLKKQKWPRDLHARLIERLIQEKASVIVFVIFFEREQTPEQDSRFSEVVKKAGNVVLCESVVRNAVRINEDAINAKVELNIEKLLSPIPPLAESAIAVTPFPLPKVPVRVSRFWAFRECGGIKPTLPFAAFQVYCRGFYSKFYHLAKTAEPSIAGSLPSDLDQVCKNGNLVSLITDLRSMFHENKTLGPRLVNHVENMAKATTDEGTLRELRILKSLIKTYSSSNAPYINFYGPPGTISKVPYLSVLEGRKLFDTDGKEIDLNSKAVFVGSTENDTVEQKDSFYTVFSQANGLDLSGVEIAATTFANLLEDKTIKELPVSIRLFLIFTIGFFLATLCLVLPSLYSVPVVIGFGILYLVFSAYQFENYTLWYPLAVPFLVQAPIAFFGAVLWKHYLVDKERRNIKTAFGFYIPDHIVEQMAKGRSDIRSGSQLLYGTCLCSDGEEYTTISESLSPEKLRDFLNHYYEAIFNPVRKHGGIITDIVGDSMVAIWSGNGPDIAPRLGACKAALDIRNSTFAFSGSHGAICMRTRIGIHSGYISLGNIGGVDHFEYRPVGDTVNTASRLEGLGRQLQIKILVSQEVIEGIDSLLSRKIGKFILAGKSKPVTVYELICDLYDATNEQKDFCMLFSQGLEAYVHRQWENAIQQFRKASSLVSADGPSRFYMNRCRELKINAPGDWWEGEIQIFSK